MNPVCTADGCDNPTDGYLCTSHAARLRAALHTVTDLWPELPAAVARTGHTGARIGGRGGEHPLPYDERAADAHWAVRNTLGTWARVIADARGTALPADNVAAVCEWLRRNVEWVRHRPWAADAYDELTACAWRVLVPAVDRHPERSYAGPCPACGADLYTHAGATVECTCGATIDAAAQRQRLLDAAAEQVRPAAWIARYATICGTTLADARVRQWKRRGLVQVREVDSAGRPLYRVGDVLSLVSATATGRVC